MAKSGKETTVLVLTLLVTLGLAGGGYWYFQKSANENFNKTAQTSPPQKSEAPIVTPEATASSALPSPPATSGINLDTSLPNPSVLSIDGSTAMVSLIKELRNAYAQINPNVPTTFGVPNGRPNGSSKGIENLINNSVVMAASSRPLQANEAQAGVQLVPIAKDAVAVVVDVRNPFQGNLTLEQVRQIYTGRITNWSQIGGPNATIKVINRAAASGTRDLFQDIVLLGQQFAPDSSNFITWPQDETTAILQALGTNGISYATTSQVENQEIVRIISIDGISPKDKAAVKSGSYPIGRNIYLAVRKQTSPAVKQFIDLAISRQGQQIAQRLGFIPLHN